MKRQAAGNYLKTHRKRSGLSQRELGKLLGYKDRGRISRHERSESIPRLAAALAYEAIFRTPVSAIFYDIHSNITRNIELRLRELETELGNRDTRNRNANLIAQKLVWLNGRRER